MIDSLAISPCPNDTFAFYGWIHEKTLFSPPKKVELEDIQTLNHHALKSAYPVSKISFACLGKILEEYVALPTGAALGYGVGPKIIAKSPFPIEAIEQKKIAVPGSNTTAFLLLKILFNINDSQITFCPYEKIQNLIAIGEVDCGLIIHETRFTFESEGLVEIVDLGDFWENKLNLPLPLGCIVAKRSLGEETLQSLSLAIQSSIQYGWENCSSCHDYILQHSQEKRTEVVEQHINLYVNKESLYLSERGIQSIETLLELGREKQLLPNFSGNWLLKTDQIGSFL